jgi:hypothetical protein
MLKHLKYLLLAAVLFALVLGTVMYRHFTGEDSPWMHVESVKVEKIYEIDAEYEDVRKILAKPESLKSIVAVSKGELIEQKRIRKNFRLLSLFEWKVEAESILKIKSADKDIGEQILTYKQKAVVNKRKMTVRTALMEPSKNIMQYVDYVVFSKDGEKTLVKAELYMKIKRLVLPFARARRIMKERVKESAEKSLESTEKKIKEIVKRSVSAPSY